MEYGFVQINGVGTSASREFRDAVLEENGEDHMANKVPNEEVLRRFGKKRTILETILKISKKAN